MLQKCNMAFFVPMQYATCGHYDMQHATLKYQLLPKGHKHNDYFII